MTLQSYHFHTTWGPLGLAAATPNGLNNPKILCYRNAVLQCLMNLPGFIDTVQNHHDPTTCTRVNTAKNASKTHCIECAIGVFSKEYWKAIPKTPVNQARAGKARVTKALNAFWKHAVQMGWPLAGPQTLDDQHDAQEFLGWVIDLTTTQSTYKLAQLFQDDMTSTINKSCDCTPKVSNIPHEGRETIKNESEAPKYLIIVVRRYIFMRNGTMKKNTNTVTYPESLDLSEYLKSSGGKLQYGLRSIVAHAGTLNSGHYITTILGPNNWWWVMNDIETTQTTLRQFEKNPQTSAPSRKYAQFNNQNFLPYIFIYEKDLDSESLTNPRRSPRQTEKRFEAKKKSPVHLGGDGKEAKVVQNSPSNIRKRLRSATKEASEAPPSKKPKARSATKEAPEAPPSKKPEVLAPTKPKNAKLTPAQKKQLEMIRSLLEEGVDIIDRTEGKKGKKRIIIEMDDDDEQKS
ncbi:MAG: hypothetical protein M1834_005017 [Cirrosporium novae-zelandiae]|nr:MAG: hypothetical protein M1834_005017 [Cirrosporium novae-zelandiae]